MESYAVPVNASPETSDRACNRPTFPEIDVAHLAESRSIHFLPVARSGNEQSKLILELHM
jgi:hypothetical protein